MPNMINFGIYIWPKSMLSVTVNEHGHSFLDFLNEAKMFVLNGRFNGSDNNFTSVSTRGKAVVDYICVPCDDLEKNVSSLK